MHIKTKYLVSTLPQKRKLRLFSTELLVVLIVQASITLSSRVECRLNPENSWIFFNIITILVHVQTAMQNILIPWMYSTQCSRIKEFEQDLGGLDYIRRGLTGSLR